MQNDTILKKITLCKVVKTPAFREHLQENHRTLRTVGTDHRFESTPTIRKGGGGTDQIIITAVYYDNSQVTVHPLVVKSS